MKIMKLEVLIIISFIILIITVIILYILKKESRYVSDSTDNFNFGEFKKNIEKKIKRTHTYKYRHPIKNDLRKNYFRDSNNDSHSNEDEDEF